MGHSFPQDISTYTSILRSTGCIIDLSVGRSGIPLSLQGLWGEIWPGTCSTSPLSFLSALFFFFSSLWIMLPQLQSKFESWENTGAGLKRQAVTSQPKSGGSGFISLFSFLLPSAVIRNLNLTQTQAVLPREQWTDSEGGKYFFYCFFQCMRAWKTKHFGDTICVGYGDWGFFLFVFFLN